MWRYLPRRSLSVGQLVLTGCFSRPAKSFEFAIGGRPVMCGALGNEHQKGVSLQLSRGHACTLRWNAAEVSISGKRAFSQRHQAQTSLTTSRAFLLCFSPPHLRVAGPASAMPSSSHPDEYIDEIEVCPPSPPRNSI